MDKKLGFDTPADAEQAFYSAFACADPNAMMAVWADVPYIVCVHPMGPQLVGPKAVHDSWQQIFLDGLPREFELEGRNAVEDSSIAIRTVQESFRVPGVAYTNPPVIATNVYQRIGGSWQMIVHHASVEGVDAVSEHESAPIIH